MYICPCCIRDEEERRKNREKIYSQLSSDEMEQRAREIAALWNLSAGENTADQDHPRHEERNGAPQIHSIRSDNLNN